MAGWVIAGIALVLLVVLGWRWRVTQRQLRQAQRQLATTQRELENAHKNEQTLHDWQMSVGSTVEAALITLDTEQHVTWANERAIKLFGDPVGKSLIEAARLYDLEALVTEAEHSAEPLDRHVTLNGQPFSARSARLPSGGSALALQDVSELQRLGRARREFVANISHELRTPLASIRLLADTLQAGALSNPAVAPDMLSKINAEVDVLSQLARELLDLALISPARCRSSWLRPICMIWPKRRWNAFLRARDKRD